MSIQTLGKKFVEMCNQGKNFDVMRLMYAENIVSVEGDGKETAGKTAVIQKSEKWAAGLTFHGEKVRGPYFNGPNQFAVHFVLEITRNGTDKRINLEEVAVYWVKDDLITKEQFFYEGEH